MTPCQLDVDAARAGDAQRTFQLMDTDRTPRTQRRKRSILQTRVKSFSEEQRLQSKAQEKSCLLYSYSKKSKITRGVKHVKKKK